VPIRAESTGELVRELQPKLTDLQAGLRWAPDGQSKQ
jgi:hypothetical protein